MSMTAPGQFDRARDAASRAAASAPAAHALALIGFSDAASVLVQPTTDRSAIAAALAPDGRRQWRHAIQDRAGPRQRNHRRARRPRRGDHRSAAGRLGGERRRRLAGWRRPGGRSAWRRRREISPSPPPRSATAASSRRSRTTATRSARAGADHCRTARRSPGPTSPSAPMAPPTWILPPHCRHQVTRRFASTTPRVTRPTTRAASGSRRFPRSRSQWWWPIQPGRSADSMSSAH